MPATYSVGIDWTGDGDFTDPGDDVSGRILDRSSLTAQYGRDQDRSQSPIAAGEASFELNNSSRDYSPENTSSPLAGKILPSRSVQIQATLAATTYSMFQGFLDGFDVQPVIESRSVVVSCVDLLARFKGVTISTPLYFSITTGQAIGLVLDAMGWPASQRDIDTGASSIQWWWEEGDAFQALTKIVNSEGLPALVTVDGSGNFVFRDRTHRLTRAASLTSQATFRDSGAEPLFSAPLTYDQGWRDVVNSVSFSVDQRQPDGALSVVWSSPDTIVIGDGEIVEIQVVANEPFTGAIRPRQDDDFTLASGTVTCALTRDSGQSTTIRFLASGGPAVITYLQLRAYSVPVVRTVQVQAQDSTSQGQYGVRSWPNDAGWAGVNDARAIADGILAYRAQRLPIVEFDLRSGVITHTRLTQQLVRDLSDRITVVEAQTGLSDDFFLERISHRVAGLLHVTTFGCEMAPAPTSNGFTFDATGLGFDQGVFGARGLDNPNLIFRVDHPTQGKFDVGIFAT